MKDTIKFRRASFHGTPNGTIDPQPGPPPTNKRGPSKADDEGSGLNGEDDRLGQVLEEEGHGAGRIRHRVGAHDDDKAIEVQVFLLDFLAENVK